MVYIFVFISGLIIGSFLNVVILRLPQGEPLSGRSKCPDCGKKLNWYDNIPVLSFFLLRARCRSCKSKISWHYPVVELSAGFLFLSLFVIYGGNFQLFTYLAFLASLLLAIGLIDYKNLIIPDSLIVFGFVASVFYLPFFNLGESLLSGSFVSSFYGILFFAGIFLFIFLISKGKWLGFGDVKLAALLGFIFGFRGAVDIFYLTFLIGGVWVIILLSFRKAGLKTEVPLGSMMALAAIAFLAFKVSILDLIWLNY